MKNEKASETRNDVLAQEPPKVVLFEEHPPRAAMGSRLAPSLELPSMSNDRGEAPRTGARAFVGTFSRSHFHPNTGQNLRFAHVEFQAASEDEAKELLWDTFGDAWWNVHALEDVREQLERRTGPSYRVS